MEPEMAEFIGIFIGDGSLNVRKVKHSYEFKFTGNIKDEIPYFDDHVSKLATSVVGRPIRTKILDGGRSIGLYFCSKELKDQFGRLGIGPGPKSGTISIPKEIFENDRLSICCARGIFDTDGCFSLRKGKYPVITFGMKSKTLILQLEHIMKRNGIGCCLCLDVSSYDERYKKNYFRSYLWINGDERVRRWFEIFGTNNPKIRKKYYEYKK